MTWHWLIAKGPESLTCCPAPHGGWEASGRSRVTPAYTPGRRRGKRAGRKAGRAAPQRRTGTDVSPGRGAAACVVVQGRETRGARAGGGVSAATAGLGQSPRGQKYSKQVIRVCWEGGEALYLKYMHSMSWFKFFRRFCKQLSLGIRPISRTVRTEWPIQSHSFENTPWSDCP